MKATKTSIIFITICFFGCSNVKSSEENADGHKDELLAAVDKFNQAFAEGNADILEPMITENYLHTNGNAKAISKVDWVNYLQKRKQDIASGILLVNSYEMDQVEIESYHKTAIVTGRVSTSTTRQGATIENEYRVTHLWVNENGNWKRAGFHDGKIE